MNKMGKDKNLLEVEKHNHRAIIGFDKMVFLKCFFQLKGRHIHM